MVASLNNKFMGKKKLLDSILAFGSKTSKSIQQLKRNFINCFRCFDDLLKSSVSCRLQVTRMNTCGVKTQGPNKKHRCGTS